MYLRNGCSNCLQICYVGSRTYLACKIGSNRIRDLASYKSYQRSQSCIGVKITFSFFLSIYLQCGVLDFWVIWEWFWASSVHKIKFLERIIGKLLTEAVLLFNISTYLFFNFTMHLSPFFVFHFFLHYYVDVNAW